MGQALKQAVVQLGEASPAFTIAAVLLYALSVLIAGLRWQLVLAGIGHAGSGGGRLHSSSLADTCLTHLSSIFVHNVTPGRVAGEVFRVAMLRRRTGISTKLAAASLGYDRLADAIPIVVLTALSLPTLKRVLAAAAGSRGSDILSLVGWALFGLAVLLAALLTLGRVPWLAAWRSRVSARFSAVRVRGQNFLLAIGCGFLLWGQDLARLCLVAAALHVPLSPWQAIPLSVVAMLCGLFPTIGGLGAVEGGLTVALCLFGISLDKALAITALERGISYVLSTAVGGLVLASVGGGELWRLSRKGSLP